MKFSIIIRLISSLPLSLPPPPLSLSLSPLPSPSPPLSQSFFLSLLPPSHSGNYLSLLKGDAYMRKGISHSSQVQLTHTDTHTNRVIMPWEHTVSVDHITRPFWSKRTVPCHNSAPPLFYSSYILYFPDLHAMYMQLVYLFAARKQNYQEIPHQWL